MTRRSNAANLNSSENLPIDLNILRRIATYMDDAVVEIDSQGDMTWSSQKFLELLGWATPELIGRSSIELVDEKDRLIAQDRRRMVFDGKTLESQPLRFLHRDGRTIWVRVEARPIRDASNAISGAFIRFYPCQHEMMANHAMEILMAGSRIATVRETWAEIVQGICEEVVQDGDYLFAWYGTKLENGNVGKMAMSRSHREYLNTMKVNWHSGPYSDGPTGRALRLGIISTIGDVGQDESFKPWSRAAAAHGFKSSASIPITVDEDVVGAFTFYAGDGDAFGEEVRRTFGELAVLLAVRYKQLRLRDRLTDLASRQVLLTTAIEQTRDSVMITDADANIVYVNSSLLTTTGYRSDEVVGRNPRIFQSGMVESSVYETIWKSLKRREAWQGRLINRAKNGRLIYEEVSISPIFDERRLIGYVGVRHDLTSQRDHQGQLLRYRAESLAVADVLIDVKTRDSLPETAWDLCTRLSSIPLIDSASIVVCADDVNLVPEVLGVSQEALVVTDSLIQIENLDQMERIKMGPTPLLETAQIARELNRAMAQLLVRSPGQATILVPIRWGESLVAILALGSFDYEIAETYVERESTLREIGVVASQLLGEQASHYGADFIVRTSLRDTINLRQFEIHFQPIVDIFSRKVQGYEALARFFDGRGPDVVFAEAQRVGLLRELELACASQAVEDSSEFSHVNSLNINFSPETLMSNTVANLVKSSNTSIVVEVTEHAVIENYSALRGFIAQIANCRLAVDDAGAGHASLRHIIELRPDVVKIDISLIHDIDSSAERQSIVAGLIHFAHSSGTQLIAEGVETDAEADTLRALAQTLGFTNFLGQGYLWGRPAKVPAL